MLQKKFGYNSKIPTKIIYPSIDVGRFKSSNYSKKIDINNIKFLTVARLHWKKGLEYSIEALSILKMLVIILNIQSLEMALS